MRKRRNVCRVLVLNTPLPGRTRRCQAPAPRAGAAPGVLETYRSGRHYKKLCSGDCVPNHVCCTNVPAYQHHAHWCVWARCSGVCEGELVSRRVSVCVYRRARSHRSGRGGLGTHEAVKINNAPMLVPCQSQGGEEPHALLLSGGVPGRVVEALAQHAAHRRLQLRRHAVRVGGQARDEAACELAAAADAALRESEQRGRGAGSRGLRVAPRRRVSPPGRRARHPRRHRAGSGRGEDDRRGAVCRCDAGCADSRLLTVPPRGTLMGCVSELAGCRRGLPSRIASVVGAARAGRARITLRTRAAESEWSKEKNAKNAKNAKWSHGPQFV